MTAVVATRRIRITVQGTVQGVGFRPFVYRLAREEALTGHVLNDPRGVEIEVEGDSSAVTRLLARVRAEAPALARIDALVSTELATQGGDSFEIRASLPGVGVDAVIAPDTATCADCLAELLDPSDRRYRYPFINCTNCGPRLTIIDGVPYDRGQTTMRSFAMCVACAREYRNPADRRFHAQPNACPACGPQVRLLAPDGWSWPVRVPASPTGGLAADAVAAAVRLLADGAIIAVKGLGGYHLAALATNERAVATLRAGKHREDKPFALMVSSLEIAATLVALSDAERGLLDSPARPIVLATRRTRGVDAASVAPSVAPRSCELGVMLAHAPLHHLLLQDLNALTGGPSVLVMTSGNVSDEPIAFTDDDALARLGSVADALLTHDRVIRHRVDDSVARVAAGGVRMLRRSRGYVPAPLTLPVSTGVDLLACGAQMKSTFCLARGTRAWISHHIGDLGHPAARESYVDAIEQFERLHNLHPQLVVHDLHPAYASTAYALARDEVELLGVQHHHAHLAACLAEHGYGRDAVAVGAIFDGTGYGRDGTIWGGEFLVGGLRGFERAASLHPIRLPGGEAAIREPWRVALAWLQSAAGARCGGAEGGVDVVPPMPPVLRGVVDPARWRSVAQVAGDPAFSPLTSSVGRLFDAVAALCGITPQVSYEGQAAVELTNAAVGYRPRRYEIEIVQRVGTAADGTPRLDLDPHQLIAQVAVDSAAGVPVGEIAAGFHASLARVTGEICVGAATDAGTDIVVLSGGVFQNRLLLELCAAGVSALGLRVLIPSMVPANDGGISFGQAVIAAARLNA
jgi:hydrogenase maturation protein HypF